MDDFTDSPPQAAQMPASQPASAAPRPPVPGHADSLGSRVLKGATWIMIQSIITQVLSLGARAVVLREVSSDDYATGTWAMSACVFLVWLQPGVGDALIQRHLRFHHWANASFWWSMLSGAAVCLAGAIIGPLLALRYHDWRFVPLTIVFSISMVLQQLSTLWAAEQNNRFQFRTLAAITTAGSVLIAVGSIAMAYGGYGPWTLIVPTLSANAVMLALFIMAGTFRPRRPSIGLLRRSRPFFKTAMLLSTAGFFSILVMSADNFFLGLVRRDELTAYAMAYTLSFSLVQLLTRSLRNVLLPAFSVIDKDSQRRDAAYLEALRLASLVAMPGAILLIPASAWVLTTVFPEKGPGAVPLFQILLCGMGFTVVYAIAFAAMQSRGLYRRYLRSNIVLGVVFCCIVWPMAVIGGARAVAASVAIYYGATALMIAIAAVPPVSGRLVYHVTSAVGAPFGCACFSAWIGARIMGAAGQTPGQFTFAFFSVLIGTGAFALMAGCFMRPTLKGAMARIKPLLPARFRGNISTTGLSTPP